MISRMTLLRRSMSVPTKLNHGRLSADRSAGPVPHREARSHEVAVATYAVAGPCKAV